MSEKIKVFVIAGEPSGDALGAEFLSGLRTLSDLEVFGVGGPLMEAQGLKSLFPMSDLAIMGLIEVLPKIPMLLSRIRQTADAIFAAEPDVVITIDSPDFCLRVLKRVREVRQDIFATHYVAPSVWAWRPERAEKMAKHVDHVLALLPFEPPLMEAAGMTCDFVGHPIAHQKRPRKTDLKVMEEKIGGTHRLAVLPGSRRGEVKRMLPLFGEVVSELAKAYSDIRLVVPTVRNSERDVKAHTTNWPVQVVYIDQSTELEWEEQKQLALSVCDGALVTSGTVSLEVAAAACPQVVAYRANRATTRMVKRMAQIDTASLVNIVTDTRDIPEFLFEAAEVDAILPALKDILDGGAAAERQIKTAKHALDMLAPPEPNAAARSVLRRLSKRAPHTPR